MEKLADMLQSLKAVNFANELTRKKNKLLIYLQKEATLRSNLCYQHIFRSTLKILMQLRLS